ncbi:MAG: type II toxin-antitoxin system VapC family toxin [Propionibacteriaceae bacterium]|jgi:predicted nucleic acid-binding protein|nr:type II toxin-antitoxin system VapC family toxin [Propionibacteriaceae bacterium]
MSLYLDTSVVVHAIAGSSNWFAELDADDEPFSSRLLELEITRTLRRDGLDPDIARPYLRRIALVSLDDATLAAAGQIPEHLKTLDAIHLATALRTDPTATMLTHDRTLAAVAAAHGFTVRDPINLPSAEG